MAGALLALALAAGSDLAAMLSAVPLSILAGLLATTGLLHVGLPRDLRGARDWACALAVGALGFQLNLALAVGAGLAAWWLVASAERLRAALASG